LTICIFGSPLLKSASGTFQHAPHGLPGRKRVAQFAYCALEDWVSKIRRDLGKRLQNEPSLMHTGMRDGQADSFNHGRPEQEDVDVDDPWAILLFSLAPHLLFEVQDCGDQLPRHLFGVQLGSAIQKPGLGRQAYGFRLVKRGHRLDRTQTGQFADCSTKIGGPVLQV